MKAVFDETSHPKQAIIQHSRKIRGQILQALALGNKEQASTAWQASQDFQEDDILDILKRVPNDPLRSYKNILLSYNTLYSYTAECNGVKPLISHYTAEKYAIWIEHIDDIEQLQKIHLQMLIHYTELVHETIHQRYTQPIEQTIQYIDQHFADDISTDQLALAVHMHPSHLMRQFKKETANTIGQYIRDKRLKEAEQFLIHSSFSITEIAHMVGYHDLAYFSRVFKKKYNMTPNQYR